MIGAILKDDGSLSASRSKLDDPLWVPLLTHYRSGAAGLPDCARIAAHRTAIGRNVKQFLLAGSTGDGWELDDVGFETLVVLSADPHVFAPADRLLFGVLRPTTAEVIARSKTVERALATRPSARAQIFGIAVCPPVASEADQDTILEHFRSVLAATAAPIAVYQLPQVTGCSIAPATMRRLANEPRIILFKDSSGGDAIARSGANGRIVALRGAEGRYAQAIRPRGPYDGWLLSSGNAFAKTLRQVAKAIADDDDATADILSDQLSKAVADLYAAASSVPFGNPFSNANRAADHVLAWGRRWPDVPAPTTVSGEPLPRDLLEVAARIVRSLARVEVHGYLGRSSSGRRFKLATGGPQDG